jgi:membrane protease YdiL (CAAX protease family)
MSPGAEMRDGPRWSYEDLALFIGAVLPLLGVAELLLRGARALAPAAFSSEAVTTLAFQSLFYALLLGALYLLISWRYSLPFWRSLRWTFEYSGAWLYLAAGPALAIATAALGVLLHTPAASPIQDLVKDRVSLVVVMLFATLLGPAFEELVFRGFLLPLLARSLGVWPGIVGAAIPFALVHGPQYQWAWQQVVLVGLVGAVFGYVRCRTGSTAAAATVHVSYNMTFFVGFVLQRSI